jgi:hypothetical protein
MRIEQGKPFFQISILAYLYIFLFLYFFMERKYTPPRLIGKKIVKEQPLVPKEALSSFTSDYIA